MAIIQHYSRIIPSKAFVIRKIFHNFVAHFFKPIKKDKNMLNQYETVFILTPVLSEEQMKETVNKFKDFITSNGGEIVHEENWGLRKLTYPIQRKSTGFYNLLEFKAEGNLIERMETEYKRDERVMRFLTVVMDKYMTQYSEKKRSKKQTEKTKED